MKDKNELVDKVAKKTNINKNDIFKLANDLQTKDLNNEDDIRSFIMTISKMTKRDLSVNQVNKLVGMIKDKKVPQDFDKML